MRSGSVMTLYIDGASDVSLSSGPTGARTAVTQLAIGTLNGGFNGALRGYINEVRVYNQASTAYITDSFERKTSGLPAALVNYYPLSQNALDFSGNGRHGYSVTNVLWVANESPVWKAVFSRGTYGSLDLGSSVTNDLFRASLVFRRLGGPTGTVYYKRLTSIPSGWSAYSNMVVTWASANGWT